MPRSSRRSRKAPRLWKKPGTFLVPGRSGSGSYLSFLQTPRRLPGYMSMCAGGCHSHFGPVGATGSIKMAGTACCGGSGASRTQQGEGASSNFQCEIPAELRRFLGVYWSLYGFVFAAGFAVQILIHEMGHYIDIKRRGLPADLPLFVPGLGAFVRWNALGVSLETRAAVSLAGPLAGAIAAAFCAGMWLATGEGIWAALARSGAWLNLLNLIPVFGLDGAHAFLAITRAQRALLLASSTVLFFLVGDGILLLIAIGAGWRLFTNDFPERPAVFSMGYFAAVLCALSALVWLLPGQGFWTS